MQILATDRILPGTTPEKVGPHVQAELRRAWELYASGTIRQIYAPMDRPGAVLILECAGLEEANQVLGTLPLVKEGLITFDLTPLRPFTSFSALFTKEA